MLADGDTLPSVRQLAQDTRVNPNTVVKAYSELENEGVITSVHGKGTFVAYGAEERLPAGSEQVTHALRNAVRMARDAGMSAEQVRQLLEDELRLAANNELRGMSG
jgi:GntR family transcriptional regulator